MSNERILAHKMSRKLDSSEIKDVSAGGYTYTSYYTAESRTYDFIFDS